MSERVTMPALGESVTEGTVTRWLKNVGDTVEVDEPLLEVSTDKVDTEIPSPVAGTLQEILVSEDDTVPVGADLAVIGDGAAAPAQQAPAEPAQEQAAEQPVSEAAPQEAAPEQAAPAQPAQPASGGGEVSGGTTVTMPALGESVTEGTVTRWLKAEGDEPLLEVSTDKVDTEIPSPVAGTLTKILVSEDDTVPVGADLAIVGGEAAAAPDQEAPKQEAPKQEAAPAPQAPKQEAPAPAAQAAPAASAPAAPAAPAATADSGTDASAYVTPLVRKLAAENNVDLGSLKGTGVGGRIRKQDVLEAAEKAKAPAPAAAPAAAPSAPAASAPSAPAVSPKRGTTEKMSRLRKVIAQRMVESLQVSAQLTTVVEVDVTKIARLRARAKTEFEQREGTKLSFLPFFALAAVEALKAHPSVNSSVEGTEVTYHGTENLGVAVDTERGLLVPVIKDAGDLNIAGLARKIADLAERTRTNKIGPDER